ncbi:MAG: ABC transporter permease subunit [Coriobacteriaceae bacterium]|nr:ABC transporter permease subunit [Coriobacteriaceae bacterium]
MASTQRKTLKAGSTLHTLITDVIFVVALLVIWELVAKAHVFGPNSEVIFPTLEQVGAAFVRNFSYGYAGTSLWVYVADSMMLLLEGFALGIVLAFAFSALSMISKTFHAIYNLVVTICDLLPGVALLPVVIVIVGVRPEVIVFLVVHAVLWPLSRNLLDGFQAVPSIYVEAGRNMGLRGMRLLASVYLPASMSYIVSGIKVCWARAWRGLISAEMIFGLASCPGIGLYINQMRTNLYNAEMYATLIVIIIIGLIVQYGILSPIERNTVVKWGMSN